MGVVSDRSRYDCGGLEVPPPSQDSIKNLSVSAAEEIVIFVDRGSIAFREGLLQKPTVMSAARKYAVCRGDSGISGDDTAGRRADIFVICAGLIC